ncbi:MAG: hypothetical protein OQK04_05875 [Kangiellaceae bacterium]|nr:hypothetical protein [Kangiellaceae bacterium]MCW8998224.1 hypothetical protein [Kangiellaceae bacterium]
MNLDAFTKEANIKQICWIDDQNAETDKIDIDSLTTKVESYLEMAPEISRAIKKQILRGYDDHNVKKRIGEVFKEPETLSEFVEAHDEPRAFLEQVLHGFEGILSETELSNMDEFFAASHCYKKLSFTEWNESKESHLSNSSRDNKLLLVVDLLNSREEFIPPEAGLEILEDVRNHENSSHIFIVVFTSKCIPDDEFIQAREIAQTSEGKIGCPIFVLSKIRDFSEEISDSFGEVFNRIVLSDSYLNMKVKITEIYLDSIEKTFNELQSITAEELVYYIGGKSQKDGTQEIDTILRVIDANARKNFQVDVVENKELLSTLSKCRRLDSQNGIKEKDLPDDSLIEKLREYEFYENIEAINTLHNQISIGDIFKVVEGDEIKYFVLLGNFCFATLRSDGTRKDKNALLFPICDEEPQHESKFPLVDLSKVISEFNRSDYFVDFTEPYTIEYEFLDRCWLNSSGNGHQRISVKSLKDSPLIRAQRNRINWFIEQKLENDLKSIMVYLKEIDSSSLRVERVARLSKEHALSIVKDYASKLSRIPRDQDLSIN